MRQVVYIVQEKKGKEVTTIAHSRDPDTGELYTEFFDRKKAKDLMWCEKISNPQCQYRLVKITRTYEMVDWE